MWSRMPFLKPHCSLVLAVINACHHEQDMRRYGGLGKLMPVTYFAMLAGFYAIIGLPGGSGFFSKDLILKILLSAVVLMDWLHHRFGHRTAHSGIHGADDVSDLLEPHARPR